MSQDLLPAEAAQQYFPTYRIPEVARDVALHEYNLSAQALTADQRSISIATGVVVVGIGFLGTIVGSDNGLKSLKGALETLSIFQEIGLFAIVLGISFVVMRYFAELQRSATHAARKIVVIRRLMGIDYGTVERVLPLDRIEGAHEPFAIAMFPGWISIGPLASGIVAAFAGTLFALLMSTFSDVRGTVSSWLIGLTGSSAYFLPGIAVVTAATLLLIYRLSVLESWETKRYLLGKLIAWEISVRLKQRMGHVLYRLELSVSEAQRVGIVLELFMPILIFTEDKRFFKHNGNDFRAIVRAIWQLLRRNFKSGGSTIDQQLFRSNCLVRLDRNPLRKPVEWMMAPWLRSRYGAEQVWRMYLCSVRFDRGVIGLSAAATHYFDVHLDSKSIWAPTTAEIFFLVERLSNVSRTIPTSRIRARLRALMSIGLMSKGDVRDLKKIYLDQIGKGLITGTMDDLEFQPE